MRRGGDRKLPRSSLAPSALEATPALGSSGIPIRNLNSAFSRRDSDASSLCSSRPASSIGALNFCDRAVQAAALRVVNGFLAPDVTLRGPLPAAKDIQTALRLLLERIDFPPNEATFEDDIIHVLRLLGCPYKIARSALKAPGTPHSWPPLLSVLHWLTLFAQYCDAEDSFAHKAPSNDLMFYITQGYRLFLSGDDDAVEALDKEYLSKARMNGEDAVATARALEKESQELEAEVNKLTSAPSRREALETEKMALTADVHKFEAVVKTWKSKVGEREEALVDLEKELEVKVLDIRRTAAENQDLSRKIDAQAVSVRDVERMHKEMQMVERDIANAENGKASLEDKCWELDSKLVAKLEELEGLAEQCNQAIKSAKMLEQERSNISSLQAKNDEMVACLNSLEREITNDDSRCTAEARRMKEELGKKYSGLNSIEKEADEFLKNSEKRLQEAIIKSDKDTQALAHELLELLDSIAEHKELMEAKIAQGRKDLYETADYIALLASKTSSPGPHT
ncbi:unnamed protein product [Urochloa decumbens]|uniref:Kinetochore protein NDC80 n=1 Tax=Urochloa decumbens TaxID=240449 RepID=A0ABC8XXS5_9POAL